KASSSSVGQEAGEPLSSALQRRPWESVLEPAGDEPLSVEGEVEGTCTTDAQEAGESGTLSLSGEAKCCGPELSEPASADGTAADMTVTHVTGASSCLVIPDSAHQPVVQFPLRTYGKQQCAFCCSWYRKYLWLHYQEAGDGVICFYCLVAKKHGLKSSGVVRNKSFDETFTKTRFCNWKKALGRFEKHQSSLAQCDSMHQVVGKNKDNYCCNFQKRI
ncbi:hypothetical protein GBAR_LOCUS25482, partial [Geodia barretti]